MTLDILFSAPDEDWDAYEGPLSEAFTKAGIDARLGPDIAPEDADYVVYSPKGGLSDFAPFTRAKAVLSLWAGVEKIVGNPTLTQPLARMVDEEGLTQGMTEWVTGHVLRHHLGMDAHIVNPGHVWDPVPPPLAPERTVAVLGLGALGAPAARALAALGFDVRGWSASEKDIAGVTCRHGTAGFGPTLDGAEVVVTLLPGTPATENVMDAAALARLAPGACLLNPGRGTLIDEAAVLAALDGGRLGHATLDVFRTEPLPSDHPFWAHPRVTVTPHVAAETRVGSAARVIAENVRRGEAGEPLLHLVDRDAGY